MHILTDPSRQDSERNFLEAIAYFKRVRTMNECKVGYEG